MTADPALVDFGDGRRLERLGGLLVDRPHPAATGRRRQPELWGSAAAIFDSLGDGGEWRFTSPPPSPWIVTVGLDASAVARDPRGGSIRLHVRPAPSGQLGIFLEQLPLWRRLHAKAGRAGGFTALRVLSLFAHTGAATLAMASAGAEVFHVDSSRQAIRTARDNAAESGLADASIHWVQEDAARYCSRLVRREARFDGILLDPPSYGHGPRGEAFDIDRDLEPLLADLAGLLDDHGFLLVTSHSPGWDGRRLSEAIASAGRIDTSTSAIESGPLSCEDEAGRSLPLGWYAMLEDRSPRRSGA